MASSALRLWQALSFSSTLAACSTATVHRSPIFRFLISSPPPTTTSSISKIGSRCVHSTSLSLSASRSYNQGNDEINQDTILFEGCECKHWLITMDFPKDPAPSPEEMVETYVQTLAKVVGREKWRWENIGKWGDGGIYMGVWEASNQERNHLRTITTCCCC